MLNANRAAPQSVAELEDQLSTPSPRAIEVLGGLDGDLILLGVGGKMGPTLARMARRASDAAGVQRRVIGVSRFSSGDLRRRLESWGVETIAANLLRDEDVAALPDAAYVICMTGLKFGASQNPGLTWATNCYLPALVCRRYRDSRIVAFSTGNVYGMVPVASGGSVETDPLRPDGEYAMTALGRERMFEYFSRDQNHNQKIPVALLRLNYATELRYGVLVDLAQQVWHEQPIDVSIGHVNVIWLADANAMTLAAFPHAESPPRIINIGGPDILNLRDVGRRFGEFFGKPVRFIGEAGPAALLNNGRLGYELLGEPQIGLDQMLRWTADWVARGGESLGKPTHFQVRDGKF